MQRQNNMLALTPDQVKPGTITDTGISIEFYYVFFSIAALFSQIESEIELSLLSTYERHLFLVCRSTILLLAGLFVDTVVLCD